MSETEVIVTLAIALAGGHGWGIVNWMRTNLGDNPEKWDWQQAGIMFVCALGVWGFAVFTGHTVQDVGVALAQPQNVMFVVALTAGADWVVNFALKVLKVGPWAPVPPFEGEAKPTAEAPKSAP